MNKTITLSSLIFTLISLISPHTQATETKTPPQKNDFLTAVDQNKDGKADKAEFMAAMEKKFNSMDVDKSEAVSVQELKIYGEKDEEARKKALQAAKQQDDFKKIISKKNFTKQFTDRAEREFSGLDKNHDNELSADEVGAKKLKKKKNAKTKHQPAKPMAKADFIALFSASAERNFTRLDKNRDGKLTDSELGIKPIATPQPKPKAKTVLPALPSLSSLLPVPSQSKPLDKTAQQQKLIKSFFVGIDANNDGKISAKEKNTVFENLFQRMDTNHDQIITQDEIIAGRHTPLSQNR